jgi:predicted TIM-barrel fold metal-dependent hydrolase
LSGSGHDHEDASKRDPLASADIIDVHHHVLPPAYLEHHRDAVAKGAPGFQQVLQWSPEKSLVDMDAGGVRAAVLSMPSPIWFGDVVRARALARMANDYSRRLASEYPGRFHVFATLPMPDIEGSIAEADHALSSGALGVLLLSNYEDSYLGDVRFRPLLEALDRRGVTVYVHPTHSRCCSQLVPQVAPAFLEFPFDTTRTIASLLYTGSLSLFRKITWIFSHGGGTLPYLADRLSQWAKARTDLAALLPDGPMAELQRLNFDTASVTNRYALQSLLAFAGAEHVLFGTDFPFVSARPQIAELMQNRLDHAAAEAIRHANAERLMPPLRG